MLPEHWFYLVAIPAVIITGMSKGGFGGGVGMLGTPLLALAVDPVRAAAILLPVLILMDIVGLISYRGKVHWSIVRQMMPGALGGTALGWATAALVPDNAIRILVGLIATIFAINLMFGEWMQRAPKRESIAGASFWGTVAGYTSFVAHAGGPPYQVYTLPLKLDKMLFAGTTVVFFAILNAVKVLPYLMLGQFSPANLAVSATLMPVAVAGVLLGVWLVRKVSQRVFYAITYVTMLAVGVKLVWDGVTIML